jgi:hypothetical protein
VADAVFEEAEAPAAAPQSGKAAVDRAVEVDELRGGNLQVGT